MKRVMTGYILPTIVVLLLMVDSFIGCAQELKQTATYLSVDSAFEFKVSQAHGRRILHEKVYYSFVNFQITPQVGARAATYLHGNFENRSNTTNRLNAKGVFRYGLKHGEWRPGMPR